MTLVVIPDIYRLNAAQREQLLNLYDGELIHSPVTVRKLGGGRVVARDKAGHSWLIASDGLATLTPTR